MLSDHESEEFKSITIPEEFDSDLKPNDSAENDTSSRNTDHSHSSPTAGDKIKGNNNHTLKNTNPNLSTSSTNNIEIITLTKKKRFIFFQ